LRCRSLALPLRAHPVHQCLHVIHGVILLWRRCGRS
jgi:hypothetical protein